LGENNPASRNGGDLERTKAEISSLIQASAKNNEEIAKLEQSLSETLQTEEGIEL